METKGLAYTWKQARAQVQAVTRDKFVTHTRAEEEKEPYCPACVFYDLIVAADLLENTAPYIKQFPIRIETWE